MIKLYVIGDSTASHYENERYPRTGWAEALQELFHSDKVMVENKALSGRSSKSFYDEKAWDEILPGLKKSDYVFIQFGHNDEKNDPARYTEPQTTFKAQLKVYIDDARKKGAFPALLTPIQRNYWEGEKLNDTQKEYSDAIRELALQEDVPLIDLSDKTKFFLESIGREKTKDVFLILEKGKYQNYPEGIIDNTHLQENGAKEIAALASAAIKESGLPIALFLK